MIQTENVNSHSSSPIVFSLIGAMFIALIVFANPTLSFAQSVSSEATSNEPLIVIESDSFKKNSQWAKQNIETIVEPPPVPETLQQLPYAQQPPYARQRVLISGASSRQNSFSTRSVSHRTFQEEESEEAKVDEDEELKRLRRELELEGEFDELEAEETRPQAQPFGAWPRKSIREINVDIREYHAKSPQDQSGMLTSTMTAPRASAEKVFAWTAPNIRYQPLYFEDVALERYGQTKGPYRQSFSSAGRFLKSAVALPKAMSVDHPASCDSPLGFCRPGSKTPCVEQKHFFDR